MYKSTSKSDQRVSVLSLADLAGGDIGDPPPDVMRENLVAYYKKLTAECATLQKGPRKSEMGQEITDVARRISAIRPKRKGPQDLGTYFMDVAREEMTKVQFDRMVAEATRRHEAAKGGVQ